MITLGTIKSEMKEFLTNRTIASRVADWVHWVHTDIISAYDFWWNKKKTSFSTTASQAEYILDHRVNGKQILWMGDENNQTKEIEEVPLEMIYRYDSTPTDTGDPQVWAYVNQVEVQAITSAASTVSVSSSSASDLSTKVVVRGRSSSIERVEEISLNGTTSVAGTISWDADGIESITLAAECVGTITVVSGSTTVAAIPAGLLRIQAPRIRLWRIPSSSLTLPYIYYQKPIKAVKDGDIIDIPDFGLKALLSGVLSYGHRNNGDYDLADAEEGRFKNVYLPELYSRSTRELNNFPQKDFRRVKVGDKLLFTLPRTITYTVS